MEVRIRAEIQKRIPAQAVRVVQVYTAATARVRIHAEIHRALLPAGIPVQKTTRAEAVAAAIRLAAVAVLIPAVQVLQEVAVTREGEDLLPGVRVVAVTEDSLIF